VYISCLHYTRHEAWI